MEADKAIATRCWHCGKPLAKRPTGGLYFVLLQTQSGYVVRVHKICYADAKRSVRQVTATDRSSAG